MYDTFENQSNVVNAKEVGAKLSYAKVFLFFGLALLITAAVTIGVSSLLYYLVRFNVCWWNRYFYFTFYY